MFTGAAVVLGGSATAGEGAGAGCAGKSAGGGSAGAPGARSALPTGSSAWLGRLVESAADNASAHSAAWRRERVFMADLTLDRR